MVVVPSHFWVDSNISDSPTIVCANSLGAKLCFTDLETWIQKHLLHSFALLRLYSYCEDWILMNL